ncbi:MAG: tRNA (guanosine(46)-N7)-methyltransferase TrmB [Bacteroidia bacterium]|nr:tRNA (guanosine(46)-N7)-methyltransferase TrmB [Bacteroidia bacterium]
MIGKIEKRRRFRESTRALMMEHLPWPGAWRTSWGFPPTAPLILEVGCGKGEFAVYLAQRRPDALVIAIDRRADRLATGCALAEKALISNVFFGQVDALILETLFAPGEIDILWLNYPDPYPKRRHEKHRLVHPRFIRQYQQLLSVKGRLYFRTDAPFLYTYALERLRDAQWIIYKATPDLQLGEGPAEAHFETEFRRRKGGTIHYIEAAPPQTTFLSE